MKKIGKNTKLYLIGMIIGGLTLGITTVVADTIINSTSVAYKTTTVKAALDELYDIADFKEEVKDMLYPVGSIYISVSSTNPSELFGGTWVSFGMGRTPMGIGKNEANTDNSFGTQSANSLYYRTSEVMGGEYGHTLTGVESGQKNLGTLTTGKEQTTGQNTYGISYLFSQNYLSQGIGRGQGGDPWVGTTEENYAQHTHSITINASDASNAHNNIQPFITVYMWKRSA